ETLRPSLAVAHDRCTVDRFDLPILDHCAPVYDHVRDVAAVGVEDDIGDEVFLPDRLTPWRHDIDEDDIRLLTDLERADLVLHAERIGTAHRSESQRVVAGDDANIAGLHARDQSG